MNNTSPRLDDSLKKLVFRHAIEFKWFYLLALISLYFTHELQSRIPFYAKELGDLLFDQNHAPIKLSKYVLVGLGIIIFRTGSRLLFFYPARVQQKYLRVELIKRLEESHPSRYKKTNSGQIYQILFNDLAQMRALVGFGFLQVANVIIAMNVLIPKMLVFDAKLFKAFTPMFVGVGIFGVLVNLFQSKFKKAQDAQGEVQNFLIESFDGKKSVKNFHAELSFLKLFRARSNKELQTFFVAGIGMASTMPLVRLGLGLSLLWSAWIIKSEGLSASTLILFSGFLYLLMEPLMLLSWLGMVFIRAKASWRRIEELVHDLKTQTADEEKLKALNLDLNQSYQIEFWNKILNFSLNPDQWTALIGETGVGKSKILYDLADIMKMKGKTISFVAQEPYLYNDSLEKNIFLGRTPSESERIEAYQLLKIFALNELGHSQEEVLKLEVGENGKRLSGGQIKRVALVRSLMSQAEVLFWDDPFSSVDLILEKEIIKALKDSHLLKSKTMILSTHRLSTLRYSDYILYLDKEGACIKAQGDTNTLIQPGTTVHEYFEKQMV
ncbi:MAG: ABC transporter transmembrane domain-containing protein [Bacteriovoracaceae bacterium]